MARRWHYSKLSLYFRLSSASLLYFSGIVYICEVCFLKKNQNAPRPSEHPPVKGKKCFCSFVFVVYVVFFVCFFCSRWSFFDVPLIFFCLANHVPDRQPRLLLGMVEAHPIG